MGARHGIDDAHDFVFGQDGWKALGFAGADGVNCFEGLVQDFAVKKKNGTEGLISLAPPARAGVGGGGNFALGGKVGDEGFDFGVAHVFGVAFAMKKDVPFGPIDIGVFGAVGVVLGLKGFAHLVEEFFIFFDWWGVFFDRHGL